jgi:hypothetical protein
MAAAVAGDVLVCGAAPSTGSERALQPMMSGTALTYLPPHEQAHTQAALGKPFKQLHREQALMARQQELEQRTHEQAKAAKALERERAAIEREQEAFAREQRASNRTSTNARTAAGGGAQRPEEQGDAEESEAAAAEDGAAWDGTTPPELASGESANTALLRLLQQQAARLIQLENEAAERRSYDQLARWQSLEASMQHQTDRMQAIATSGVSPVWRNPPAAGFHSAATGPFRRAPTQRDDMNNVRRVERHLQPTVIGGGGGRQRWIPPSKYASATSPCHTVPAYAHLGDGQKQPVNRATPPSQQEVAEQLSQGARHGPAKHAELYFGPGSGGAASGAAEPSAGMSSVDDQAPGVAACACCHVDSEAGAAANEAGAASGGSVTAPGYDAADALQDAAVMSEAAAACEMAEAALEGLGTHEQDEDEDQGGNEIDEIRAELAAALAREEEAKDVAEMVLTLAAAKEAESRQALASMAISHGTAHGLGPHGVMVPGPGQILMQGSLGAASSAYRRHRPAPQRSRGASASPQREPRCFTSSPARAEVSIFRSNLGSVGSTGFDTELLPGESAWAAVGEVDEALTATLSSAGSTAGSRHRAAPVRPRSAQTLRKSQTMSHGLLAEERGGMAQSASQGALHTASGCYSAASRSNASNSTRASNKGGRSRKADSATLQLEAFNNQRMRLGLSPIDPPVWSTPEHIRKVVAKSLKEHAFGTPIGGGSPNKRLYHAPRSVKCSYSSGRSVPSWNWSTKVAGGPEPPRGLGQDPMMEDADR